MKTSSGILAFLASSTVLALPYGDKKRDLPSEEETLYLKQAIEVLSSYEYGGNCPYPPTKPLKGTGGIKAPPKCFDIPAPYPPKSELELQYVKNEKRSPLKKEEEIQIQQAIEILSSYEYGQPGPGPKKPFPVKSGPFYPQDPDLQYVPKTKRAPLKQEEEYELKQAIELLSYYEYGQPPSGPIKPYSVKPKYPTKPGPYFPTLDEEPQYVPKTKRSSLKIEEQYEILSQYEYGQPHPPVNPIKPIPVKPTPYDPLIKGNPKYAIPRSIDDVDATESIRAAIELLSKYEYGPQSPPLSDLPERPYRLGPNEHIPRSVPNAEKESLIAAIELLNKYEYTYPPYPPIKPAPPTYTVNPDPVYTLEPVPTVKPAPVPKYDPALVVKGPVIGKRKINDIVDQYSEGWSEADYHLAIEQLTQKEYIKKPVPEPYEPYTPVKPITEPESPNPAPTYKPVPIPTLKPKPFPPYQPTGPFIPGPKTLPQYPKRSEPSTESIDVDQEQKFRLAIELLSKIEYDQPGPVKPFPGKPFPGKPYPQPGYPVPQPGPVLTFDVEKEATDSKVQ